MSRRTRFAVSVAVLAVVALAVLAGRTGQNAAPARPYEALILDSPLNHIAVIGDSYTAGTDEGGRGPNGWTARAWQRLAHQGVQVTADEAAEGGAGYGARGDHGSVFEDLTARAVHPDDVLVVFFGSRNDRDVDPDLLTRMARDTFALVQRTTPSAKLLVIGPPWPTADVLDTVLHIRDILAGEAQAAGAAFVDPIAEHWFVGRPDLIGTDGVHPNDAGHAYLADKIAPLIDVRLPRRV